jgi:hypothetical protein
MRWLWVGVTLFWAVYSFFPSVSSSPFIAVIILSSIISVLGAQIYRYRRVSTPVQRQKTKWVVYGLSIGLGGFLALDLFWIFNPAVSTENLFGNFFTGIGVSLFFIVIPLSVGLAILRTHLFDIDRIINRTLVYSLLTAILAVVYFGCIIALQSLVSLFTGHISSASQTPPVLVASTLGIFALAQPLRRRIQALIDRQFYRSRYNAARTLAAFTESLRGELDLDQLSERLMTVVHETMQPSHVSLWLRTPEPSETRNTRVLPRID